VGGRVGGGEVGDHHAEVGLLAGGRERVGEGARGDVGDRAVANLLGVEVVEVGRHLIEQDEDGLSAVKQRQPVLLIRSLGTIGLKRLELFALAELIGDCAPEAVVRVVAPTEGGDVGRVERLGVQAIAAMLQTQRRVLGQQTEADQQVRLPTAHGLLEMEDSLAGDPSQAGDAFSDQILHALGDVGLGEESVAIPLAMNQLIELLDLIAESDRQGVGLELTGVADGFPPATVLSMSDQSLGCGECGMSFTSFALASSAVKKSSHGW
jgi:hypothetical protein